MRNNPVRSRPESICSDIASARRHSKGAAIASVQKIDEAGHRPSRSRFSNRIVGYRQGTKPCFLYFIADQVI
jgi:hypothetical protein